MSDTGKTTTSKSSTASPKPDSVTSVMLESYEYYSLRRAALNRKLRHAQTATKCSLREITETSPANSNIAITEAVAAIDTYDKLWTDIVASFSESFISDAALEKIEEILTALPRMIMKFYKILVTQDTTLQKLLAELLSEKYKKAQQIISTLQSMPCPLSGLDPEEFSFPDDMIKLSEEAGRAYKIEVPKKSRRDD